MVFGSINFHETKTDGLEKLAFRAYKEILGFLDRMEFPYLVRCWNYFPGINQENNGIERYKLFCSGRHEAFAKKYQSMHGYLPAATAVGSQSGPLTINFIAARNSKGEHIENPYRWREQMMGYDHHGTWDIYRRLPALGFQCVLLWSV